jgi:hypothetical protein
LAGVAMKCEIVLVSGEAIGLFSFEVVPRHDEMIKLPGREFKVSYVEHQIDITGEQAVRLVVWKFD